MKYLITPCSRILFDNKTDSHLVKKFLAFYGTCMIITSFTSPRHLFLSWATWMQSVLPSAPANSRRSILELFSYLRLGLQSGLILSGFPTKSLYAPLLSSIIATRPTHLIVFDLINRLLFDEKYSTLSY
jgi:hypothetical protein